jgi:DNA-binding transcriptional MocR family regulator
LSKQAHAYPRHKREREQANAAQDDSAILFEPVRGGAKAGAATLVDQLVEAIESAIQRRVLRRGMPVPSIRQFAREYGISTFTVSAAYSRLVAQGLLSARAGAGYRVASGPGLSPSPALAPETAQRSLGWTPPQIGASWLLADVFADHSIPIKSGCGWKPSEWMGEAGMRKSFPKKPRTPIHQIAG